MTFSLQ